MLNFISSNVCKLKASNNLKGAPTKVVWKSLFWNSLWMLPGGTPVKFVTLMISNIDTYKYYAYEFCYYIDFSQNSKHSCTLSN
jgi:hypothetical protein